MDSLKYKTKVRIDIQHLKQKQGDSETIVRLEKILGRTARPTGNFMIDHFFACDREAINFSKWRSRDCEHILIYLNGLESHAGWFSEIAHELVKNNITVYGLDRRGSGLNPRSGGKYQDWICDVVRVIEIAKKENPGAKTHLASICFGAKLATACAIRLPREIDSLIYISPGINVKVGPTVAERMLIGLDKIPGLSFNIRSPIRDDHMFTDSPEALFFLYNDKLRTYSPRAADFYQAKKLNSNILKNLTRVTAPSIVFLAKNDKVVDLVQTRKTFGEFGARPKVIEYADCEHALFFGGAKSKLVADIIDFVQSFSSIKDKNQPEPAAMQG